MIMKFVVYAVQFGTAALLFLFSALVSWYQGSELLNVPWEWKYSAKFTKLMMERIPFKTRGIFHSLIFSFTQLSTRLLPSF